VIVIADTTPVNYLILINEINILALLYGRVIIPMAVFEELRNSSAPLAVRTWMEQLPDWLEVRTPATSQYIGLVKLDAGERDAILLAEELAADRLIIDELHGRREAERRGLHVIGTLGVLKDAAEAGLLDLANAIESLRKTSFYIAPEILSRLLKDLR
jgi:predicted nucleic acid-binding protein